jgi:hypothetical protein
MTGGLFAYMFQFFPLRLSEVVFERTVECVSS